MYLPGGTTSPGPMTYIGFLVFSYHATEALFLSTALATALILWKRKSSPSLTRFSVVSFGEVFPSLFSIPSSLQRSSLLLQQ